MKKSLRLIVVSLLSACVLSGAVGCGGNNDLYEGKTIINFGCYDGGWGREWLDDSIVKFEEMYPEYHVEVYYDKSFTGETLRGKIDTIQQDIFYGSLNLYDYLDTDKLMDVTDVLTTPLNEYLSDSQIPVTETKTIESKIWKDMKDYCTSYDGKYYNTPFGGGFYSLNYDRDLFNSKRLFLTKNGSFTNLSGDLALGQDGIADTYDDGLPVTYAEFKKLLEQMSKVNVIPFTWSSVGGYTQHFAHAFAVAQDGVDVFNIFKFMNGEYTFTAKGETTPTTITKENAYLLCNTNGKKDALQFAKDVITGKYYDPDAGSSSMDYMTAQDTYLYSVENAKHYSSAKPIAFFIDGGHWYNEAKNTLAEMADMSDDYRDRKIGVMPFPWCEDATATKSTYFMSSPNSALFIRKNATEAEGSKKLLAFLNSDESLKISSKTCGIIRYMDYELDDEDLQAMPYYYQTMWKASRYGDLCYNLCDNPVIFRNYAYFDEMGWEWSCTTASNLTLNNPLNDFKNSETMKVTVDEFFNAILNTRISEWSEKIK